MPKPQITPPGGPCWIDLMTSDTERSRDFYQRLFGWTADEPDPEFGGYFNFTKDGAPIAGCMVTQEPGMPDAWSVYLQTDDARKTLDTALAEGGQVYVEPMPVADLGTMAYAGDPGGAGVGVWQPGQFTGFAVVTEPGAPSWFELHTRDYERVVGFYRDVFRWDTHVTGDTPDFRYTTLQHDGQWYAGIMDASSWLPDGAPGQWQVYFGAEDTDAALAKVVDLGGSVVRDAEDTPYGRLATVADPIGAQFRLVAANAAMPRK